MTSRTIVVTDRDFWHLSALVRARTAAFSGDQARDQAHIDELEEELARSVPVAATEMPAGVVTMHSRVQVRDLDTGAVQAYTLVFPHESDLPSGRLSVLAPLGTALLGYRAGDTIEWAMPGGVRRVRIESVRQPWGVQGSVASRRAGDAGVSYALSPGPSLAQLDGAA